MIYNNTCRISCFYDKLIISDYLDDDFYLSINGTNLDRIYENFVIKIGNINIKENNTLSEQLKVDDEIVEIEKKIEVLENKIKNEKQFNKAVDINKEINILKLQIDNLKKL